MWHTEWPDWLTLCIRWRQLQETGTPTAWLPKRRQRQRVSRRFSPLGRCKKWPDLHTDQKLIKVEVQKEHEYGIKPNAKHEPPGHRTTDQT